MVAEMRMEMMLKVMVKMDEVVMLPAGYPTVPTPPPHRPGGRLLFRFFLEPNNLTRENTFSLLGFSFAPLLLLGLPLPRHAFAFSRSLACRFWRIRELAIAAARDMFPRWSETRLRVLGWRGRSRTRRSGCVERGERG